MTAMINAVGIHQSERLNGSFIILISILLRKKSDSLKLTIRKRKPFEVTQKLLNQSKVLSNM